IGSILVVKADSYAAAGFGIAVDRPIAAPAWPRDVQRVPIGFVEDVVDASLHTQALDGLRLPPRTQIEQPVARRLEIGIGRAGCGFGGRIFDLGTTRGKRGDGFGAPLLLAVA